MNPNVTRILINSAAAAAFFFVLQRYALGASIETSLLWAVALAVAAAWLTWQQSRPR